jgi:hypothetical protein
MMILKTEKDLMTGKDIHIDPMKSTKEDQDPLELNTEERQAEIIQQKTQVIINLNYKIEIIPLKLSKFSFHQLNITNNLVYFSNYITSNFKFSITIKNSNQSSNINIKNSNNFQIKYRKRPLRIKFIKKNQR